MPLKYYGLFSILAEREMKKTDLLKFVSSPTIAKLSKHERVSLEVIETLCDKLDVQPGDIVKFVREESPVPPPSPDEPPKPKGKDKETKSESSLEAPSEAAESPKAKLNAGSVELLKGQILLSVPMPDGTTETVIAWEDDSVELAKKEAAVRNAKPGSLERDLAEVTLNRFKYSMKVRNDEYLEGLTG